MARKKWSRRKAVRKLLPLTGSPVTGEKLTVGWLVVINGVLRGHDFRLLSGQNRIGRNPSMDIASIGDASVTGEDHAKLIFDPLSQHFHLWHDKGRNLTYVNDELVDKRVLQAYDLYPALRVKVCNLDPNVLMTENAEKLFCL